jgi:folate-binding protein YgfZ
MSGIVGIDLSAGPAGLGVLAFRGADAARFLQGQLSANIEKLAPGTSTFAGFHNPQGRVIALLAVAAGAGPDELFALLPHELAAGVAQRLAKFVLRAKVRIDDESAQWRALGLSGESALPAAATFAWGMRRVLLVKAGDAPAHEDRVAREAWERADIAAGLPQVYAATSETFVAQMLNLDLLGGAIAFDKGCYTGQEVIARAHYRGRVKRRLQRWHNLSGTRLEPGQAARSGDGRALVVVRVAADGPGAQEILAVGAFGAAPAEAEPAGEDVNAAPRVNGPLALPYALPD